MFFSCKHKWKTVAIDTSCHWHFVKNPGDKNTHILLYQVCEKCGERQMEYDDPTKEGRAYAIAGNDNVAQRRSVWIHSGDIPMPKNSNSIKFTDPDYAPHGHFERWLRALKVDPALEDLLKQPMVKDALGQLEVAAKLCAKNAPKEG